MKFYECRDTDGVVFDCVLSLKEARDVVAPVHGDVCMVEVEVTAESVRRLIGNLGGYAKAIKHHS